MKAKKLTNTEMAKRLQTTERQIDRLFDPIDDLVSISTLHRAAAVIGRTLHFTIV